MFNDLKGRPPQGSISPNTPAPNLPSQQADWRSEMARAKAMQAQLPPPPGPMGPPAAPAGGPPMPPAPGAGPMPAGPGQAPMGPPPPGGPQGPMPQSVGGVANALRNRRDSLGY